MIAVRSRTILLAALLAHLPAAALAENDAKSAARDHFELGKALYSRSDYAGAIREFRESYRLFPLPALLFNVARSHEALGQHASARFA